MSETTPPRPAAAPDDDARDDAREDARAAGTLTGPGRSPAMRPLAILHLNPLLLGPLPAWEAELERAAGLGFTAVGLPPPLAPGRGGDLLAPADHERAHPLLGAGADATEGIAAVARAARAAGLDLLLDLAPERAAADGALLAAHPGWFRERPDGPPDPRRGGAPLHEARLDLSAEAPLAWWEDRLRAWRSAGAAGFRVLSPGAAPLAAWARLAAAVPGAPFLAWSAGMPRGEAAALPAAGFTHLASSVAWWDGRAGWLAEERAALPGPLLAFPEPPFGPRAHAGVEDPARREALARRSLTLAALTGDALLVPLGFEHGARRPSDPAGDRPGDLAWLRDEAPYDLTEALREALALHARAAALPGEGARPLLGPGAPALAWLRAEGDPRSAGRAAILLANAREEAVTVAPETLLPAAGGALGPFRDGEEALTPGRPLVLAPGEARLFVAGRAEPALSPEPRPAEAACEAPRIGIEAVTPLVDGGRFPVKRVVGDLVEVEADVVADTHATFAACLLWRPADERAWREAPMRPLGNDRWAASFPLERMGRHLFAVEAWLDRFAAFRDEVTKKHAAGLDVTLELEEGRLLVARRAARPGPARKPLLDLARALESAAPGDRLAALLSPETAALMARADPRPHRVRQHPPGLVDAERAEARFAAWYEVFPRSQSGDPARHGTFDDVVRILPRVRAMGFDVLYFPPIHPVGAKNRKGRNNSLTARPGDPGSPYATGAAEGGHDAVHPELGGIEAFRRLIRAAADHGLEIALDFAIQCSPDHPWLAEHPGWFDWRPDGTIRYAENPPKKYEDIVNVDFYAEGATPSLWTALRDAVLFWVSEGVKTFRVDNPHTKPLPFWEWMIAEVRGRHPEVIFLSEAFTRPKVMHRLAKVGFSQSYTYFTWRETKAELAAYLTELTTTAPRDFFRPHFFVNTPDINPRHLQTGGRPMHLARACLAATLSGLWGVYQGFELCEATPVPGREEYLDSEKYEIRAWPDRREGDIVDEVARLNAIRRANPALHDHRRVEFLNAWDEGVLLYERATPDRSNVLLVAVSVDPSRPREAGFEVPLWKWGLPDEASVEVEDLLRGTAFRWQGKAQRLRLDPADLPYAVWRLRPSGA